MLFPADGQGVGLIYGNKETTEAANRATITGELPSLMKEYYAATGHIPG